MLKYLFKISCTSCILGHLISSYPYVEGSEFKLLQTIGNAALKGTGTERVGQKLTRVPSLAEHPLTQNTPRCPSAEVTEDRSPLLDLGLLPSQSPPHGHGVCEPPDFSQKKSHSNYFH